MSGRKQQDEMLFCERCGISFLWTSEEQKQTAAGRSGLAPTLCAGCRHLLPGPQRERGLIKWYNLRKNYGFILRRNAPDLYVHGSALLQRQRLGPGDLVEFSVASTERGPAAQAVSVLERMGRDE